MTFRQLGFLLRMGGKRPGGCDATDERYKVAVCRENSIVRIDAHLTSSLDTHLSGLF